MVALSDDGIKILAQVMCFIPADRIDEKSLSEKVDYQNFIEYDCYGEEIHANSRIKKGFLNLKGVSNDKGNYDWLIDELGLTKINVSEIPDIMKKCGIEVLI